MLIDKQDTPPSMLPCQGTTRIPLCSRHSSNAADCSRRRLQQQPPSLCRRLSSLQERLLTHMPMVPMATMQCTHSRCIISLGKLIFNMFDDRKQHCRSSPGTQEFHSQVLMCRPGALWCHTCSRRPGTHTLAPVLLVIPLHCSWRGFPL